MELLIAIAILSIVIAAVCGFILVGSRSYAAGNSDISVQQEAQLALNQMSDVVIDTTRSVNYVGYDASGSPQKALKDAEFTFTPEDKSLIMFNGMVEETAPAVPGGATSQTVDPGNGNKHYHFYWSKDTETLYYTELEVQSTDVDTTSIHFPAFDPADPVGAGWVELAGHVTDFSVDLSQVEEKRVVQLALTFLDGTKEYVTSNNVTIRNKVGVNDAELAPLNRKKTLSVTPRDTGVILEPGEEYHFSTPKVTGQNVADRSVTWSLALSGSPSGGTRFTDTANGILQVATDEPAGTISVVITTNAVDSDGNHASCTMTVYIKRVREVSLSKTDDEESDNGPNEVTPGSTFTIGAVVGGEKLGVQCSGCTADIAHDFDVVDWRITQGAEYVDIVDVGDCKQETQYSVKSGTAEGTEIKIAATSELSKNRLYDPVHGEITLTVTKSKKNIGLNPGLRWGAVSTLWVDYVDGFNKAGQGYFLICARVRELDSTSGDKIMIFRTTGWNTLITPDLFGVEDISKPWYISLQVIDPGQHIQQGVGPSEQLYNDLQWQINDPRVKDVVNDYLANSPDGTYNGKYPHTDKLEAYILPPEIFYRYGDQSNLGGELHLDPVSILEAPQTTSFSVSAVLNTRADRDGESAFINDHLKFSVYKEKDGGGLEPIYVYKQENGTHYNDSTKGGSREGNASPYGGILKFGEAINPNNALIKLDSNEINNHPQEVPNAPGRYRIVPTIQYHNNPSADTSYSVYYANYQPWYWHMRVYEVPESTVYYELMSGGNLELWSYYNNEFTKGEIYFPTPSSAQFLSYFNRENTDWQNAKYLSNFTKTVPGRNSTTFYQPSSMRCRYVANSKVYQLELFYNYYDPTWGRAVEVSAGVFQCAANGSRWERKDRGTFDSQLESGNRNPQVNSGPTAKNVKFEMWGTKEGSMYIPLPSEHAFSSLDNNGFGFTLKQSAEQSRDWKGLKFQATGQTNTEELWFEKVTCTYNAATDEYTLKLFAQNNPNCVAAFTCNSNGKEWTQQ